MIGILAFGLSVACQRLRKTKNEKKREERLPELNLKNQWKKYCLIDGMGPISKDARLYNFSRNDLRMDIEVEKVPS